MAKPAATVDDQKAVEAHVPQKELGPVFKAAVGSGEVGGRTSGSGDPEPPEHPQGLPRPLVVPARGDRALLLHHPAASPASFLTFWYKPSMAEIEYEGTYQLLRGVQMSEAFASTLAISFDIRGGLLVRQMHHWAADAVPGRDARAQPPRLLHRRVPQAPRDQLAARRRPADDGPHRGLRRLLAAGRPALGHRPPVRRRAGPLHPADRHLGRVLHLRRGVPGRPDRRRGSTSSTSCCCPRSSSG